jgi:D-alanyl-D-alanine carboxypeptidase
VRDSSEREPFHAAQPLSHLRRLALYWLTLSGGVANTAHAQNVAPPGPHVADAAIVRDLRRQVRQLAADSAFSGAVLLARDGKILYQGVEGYADRASGRRNDLQTSFNLGSLGKAFTAVAVLQLAQSHRLSLDDSVGALLPDYPDVGATRRATVRQLLSHTGGLGDIFTEQYLSAPSRYCSGSSYLSLFAHDSVRAVPGTAWSYSNAGYIVLQMIVERVSGQSLDGYLRDHIFRPAGMQRTGGYTDHERDTNRAVGYTTRRGLGPPSRGEAAHANSAVLPGCASGAGGGYSTVDDLLRFAVALRRHTLLDTEHTQLLLTGAVAQDVNEPAAKSTMGLDELTVNGVRTVGHGGNFPGVSSTFDMYPDLGYAAIVLSNIDNGVQPVTFRLRWILRGQVDQLPTVVALPLKEMRAFAGRYAIGGQDTASSKAGPPVQITADSTGLLLQMGRGGAPRRFLPVSPTAFVDRDLPPLRLTFSQDASGAVTGLTIEGTGPSISASRSP